MGRVCGAKKSPLPSQPLVDTLQERDLERGERGMPRELGADFGWGFAAILSDVIAAAEPL